MQRANQWRIRDEEEYAIALAYLRRTFDKSPSFWRNSSNKKQARKALQPFDDTLPVDEEQFDRLNKWISDYLDEVQLKKLRVAMRVGKSRNRHKRTQVTLDKEVHERLSAQAKALGLNLSQTVSLLLDQFQHKEQ
jgi:macrodomain Ter protein organizer (MatP/YcbG family)